MSNYAILRKPHKQSEFELQAELYFRLKMLGLDVRGEVPSTYQKQRSFFDLVVFRGDFGAVIIEVKNGDAVDFLHGKHTRQRVKYSKYGLPLVIYTTATKIQAVIDEVQHHLSQI